MCLDQTETMLTLTLREASGLNRDNEPISIGVPFPKGAIYDHNNLVSSQNGMEVPSVGRVVSRWPDGAIKWMLFDMQLTMFAKSTVTVNLDKKTGLNNSTIPDRVEIEENEQSFIVRTGTCEFYIDRKQYGPFSKVMMGGDNVLSEKGSSTVLIQKEGIWGEPIIDRSFIESSNELKAVLCFECIFSQSKKKSPLRFRSRLFFYAGKSYVRMDMTLLNPSAATHKNGLWDLGDQSSVVFQGLKCCLSPAKNNKPWSIYCCDIVENNAKGNDVLIYQDSSGGENWDSRNHIDYLGESSVAFSGYRVLQQQKIIREGKRASPTITSTDGNISITVAIQEFWQNFPSALEVVDGKICVWPFPVYAKDSFELQGGEQKTHRIYLNFSNNGEGVETLAWVHDPLIPVLTPQWYEKTGVFPYMVPHDQVPHIYPYKETLLIKDAVIRGENTFFDRREIVDEYGWRNFGDQYADHENLLFEGKKPIIAHYNNQYDLINSFLYNFTATGSREWYTLANQLARHISDIDIYHTDEDKYCYNHGLFWHTDHYCDAHTSTHRCYSRQTMIEKKLKNYGGGPSYEHVYVRGLVNHYFMTGEQQSKEAALELVDFVKRGIQGPDSFKQNLKEFVKMILKRLKKSLKTKNVEPYGILEGPGRASGNALNVLLDGYSLSQDKQYLDYAHKLIKKCINPGDDPAKRDMEDVNMRWPYTIFLQAIGRFLDLKIEINEVDDIFFYARDSLIQYADWMVEHEQPFLSRPELIDFPNYATRSCTDMRKTNVLLYAAKYGPVNEKGKYCSKANYFLENSVKDLLNLEQRTWTRPLAILMQNIQLPIYVASRPDDYFNYSDQI